MAFDRHIVLKDDDGMYDVWAEVASDGLALETTANGFITTATGDRVYRTPVIDSFAGYFVRGNFRTGLRITEYIGNAYLTSGVRSVTVESKDDSPVIYMLVQVGTPVASGKVT